MYLLLMKVENAKNLRKENGIAMSLSTSIVKYMEKLFIFFKALLSPFVWSESESCGADRVYIYIYINDGVFKVLLTKPTLS